MADQKPPELDPSFLENAAHETNSDRPRRSIDALAPEPPIHPEHVQPSHDQDPPAAARGILL